eukprot:3796245-Heterocapsa_arctica.AAC.1
MNTITVNDVKDFLAKQTSRQTKQYAGFNSYVAHRPQEEYQCDLMDFTESAKNKTPESLVKAFKETLATMGVCE